TSEQVRQYVGEGLTRFLEKALLNPTPSELAEAKKWFHEYYRKHLITYTKPYPGIQEILDFFSNKKKAVLTNKPLDYTQHILSALNLDHYFDVIMGSSDELPLKPHPDGIHQILKETQVSADKTIMIGDGETDIMAGKAANVITCAVGYGFRDVEYLLSLEPDFLIENVYELKTIIR
ncbi:MAG: HAD family hydrolase, partial [Calditrichaeota bacterium]